MNQIKAEVVYDFDSEALDEMVIQEIADRVISQNDYPHEITRKVLNRIDAIIEDRVSKRVAEILMRDIQPMDRFGEKKGEPLRVEDYLLQSIDGWMDTLVKNDGTPSSSAYDSRKKRGEWLVEKFAVEGIARLASQEIKKVRAEAERTLRDKIAAAMVVARS